MTRRSLFLQHFNDDGGGRIGELLAAMDVRGETVALHRGEAIPSLAPYDLMVVLGGTQQVWQEAEFPWLQDEKRAIREWVRERARPYIGICFGHQLLAAALGGAVGPADQAEIGVRTVDIDAAEPHPFVAGLGGRRQVMQWHSAEVKRLPAEATMLASSATTPVEAMAVDGHALGVQFHCEWTLGQVRQWGTLPGWIRALDEAFGAGGHARFLAACTPAMAEIQDMTDRLFDNFRRSSKL
jgi:GMP synthase-like glutamine amidotransferase